MTVRTTLSFTDRHHDFLSRKVDEGVFATASAAVATAIEQMMLDEAARETALASMGNEIRARMQTPQESFTDPQEAFAAARAVL